jgi:hypothetical protein
MGNEEEAKPEALTTGFGGSRVYGFGAALKGELGSGKLVDTKKTPFSIEALEDRGTTSVSCGDSFSFALTGSSGRYGRPPRREDPHELPRSGLEVSMNTHTRVLMTR